MNQPQENPDQTQPPPTNQPQPHEIQPQEIELVDIIYSDTTKAVALVVGYFSAFTMVVSMSETYLEYFGDQNAYMQAISATIASLLFMSCTCYFGYATYMTKPKTNLSPLSPLSPLSALRRVDYGLLVMLSIYTLTVCRFYALHAGWLFWYRNAPVKAVLIVCSLVFYTVAIFIFGETIARLRDRILLGTTYWLRLFQLSSTNRPVGFAMTFLLAGNLVFFLFANLYVFPDYVNYLEIVWLLTTATALTSVALSYVCSFILTMSIESDNAHQEKLQSERLKVELLTNVSHDLRTPLTAIVSYVDLLKHLPIEHQEFQQYVTVLDSRTARLKVLTDDLFEASKAASGNLAVNNSEINLLEIVGQIAGEFDDEFTARNLTVVFHQPTQPVIITADSQHLWRVLENLFKNAAKYAMPGTRVFVEIAQTEHNTVFTLKNTSEAPVDYDVDTLTEQFTRGDRSRKTDGSGLGLYIAKNLIELMNGRFTVRVNCDLFEVEIEF